MGATRTTLVLPLVAELEGWESLGGSHHPRIGLTPSRLKYKLDRLRTDLNILNIVAIPFGPPILDTPPIPILVTGILGFLVPTKIATENLGRHGDDLAKAKLALNMVNMITGKHKSS
jgi:hypothetical protein